MRSLALALLPLLACTAQPSLETQQHAIINGELEPGYGATGAIQTVVGGYCSGVLIHPRVVLTAAHCLYPRGTFITPLGFFLGPGTDLPADTREVPADADFERYGVAEAISFATAEQAVADDCPKTSSDTALLLLDRDVLGVAPVVLGGEPEVDALCTVVGYGRHENADGSESRLSRRSATLTYRGVALDSLHFTRTSGISNVGDSGGPMYCGDRVVGVVSCADEETFETEDYYARLSTIRQRIDAQMASWNLPALPNPDEQNAGGTSGEPKSADDEEMQSSCAVQASGREILPWFVAGLALLTARRRGRARR